MADGPEAVYADLTSGQPAALDAAIEACAMAIRQLADAIDLISLATDKPEWDSSEAYEAYNLRAWSTRAAAEVALIRVNRTSLALQMAAGNYASVVDAATNVIEHWRRIKRSDGSGDGVVLARMVIMLQLYALRTQLDARLLEAIDFVQTDALTGDQEQWRTSGLIKSMLHDLNSPNDFTGPMIPNTLATGDDDGGWKPQGLGYDPDGRPPALLQTAYSDGQAQLAMVDPETGEQLGFVNLGGFVDPDDQLDAVPPDHAGGVTVHGDSVYVMSSGKPAQMYTYSIDDIHGSTPGETIQPHVRPVDMAAGAWSTIDGDIMYVGSHEENSPGQLFTYKQDASGAWVKDSGPHPIPPQTQGAAVIDGQVVFSTSFGRGNTSELQSYRLGDVLAGHGADEDHRLGEVSLPTMSEGVIAIDGQGLLTTFESGATEFSSPKDGVSLEELWAAQSMTITPFSALGLTGGIAVAPVSLDQASIDFDAAGIRLRNAATSVDEVTLPAGCLGRGTQGDAFASVITHNCDETSQWITEGRISAEVTADGLTKSAASYVAADQSIQDAFASISSWLGGP